MIHFLSLNIWYVIYVVFWIKYWNLKLPHHCILFLFTICTVSQLFWNRVCSVECCSDCVYILREGRVPPRHNQLNSINHKIKKTMYSTVLSASLLSSRAIGNFLFPTYDVMITSTLHSFLLKIRVNSGLWMLMLSLNKKHLSGMFMWATHPKCSHWLSRVMTLISSQYWSTFHSSCDPWFVFMWIQSQWTMSFHNNNKNKNLC